MTLKLKNTPIVMLFVVWCTAILTVCFESPSDFWSNLSHRFATLNAKDGVLIALSPLISLVAVGLLPPNIKAMSLFWRIKHPLPGHRAFSRIAQRDPRVNLAVLKKTITSWPKTPAEENQTWYRLYRQHQDQPGISDSHRAFLLSRDLASCALCFLVIGAPIIFNFGSSRLWASLYCGFMAIQYLALAIVGRNHGVRFVQNVLAEASLRTS